MDESQKRVAIENPTSLITERKFDVPLRDTFLKTYFKEVEAETNNVDSKHRLRYDTLIQQDLEEPLMQLKTTPDHYAHFLLKVLNQKRLLTDKISPAKTMKKLKSLINQSIIIQTRYNQSSNYTNIRNIVLSKMQDWIEGTDLTVQIMNLLIISQYLSRAIDKSQKMYNQAYQKLTPDEYQKVMKGLCTYSLLDLDITFRWSEKLLVISIGGLLYVQPRSVLLMYHNKVCDLISVLAYALFSSGTSSDISFYNTTVNTVKEMANLLIKFKNNAFSIFKVLEGLVTAETLIDVEQWDNYDFLDNITLDLLSKTRFHYVGSKLQQCLRSADIPDRHNLGCLSKILGYPLVSIEEGAKKLHEKVTQDVLINVNHVQECINHCKRDYIKKYVQVKHTWPPTEVLGLNAPRSLRYAQIYGKDPDCKFIRDRYGPVPIHYYNFVEIEKNYEFNEFENIIPLLKDKTISLYRNPVFSKFLEGIKPDEEWQEVRLLLAYLLNPSMVHDHVGFLRKYTLSKDFTQLLNYLVIRVVPKEKELKIDFRGFGCQTYENRHKALAQEKNVSMYLNDFADEQTLTNSELQILKKLDVFRRITKAYQGYMALYVVIDASAWNNRFSSKTVDDFCKNTFDRMFANSMFSKTHKCYENTFVYVPDGGDIYYWDGQRGGIEGLNQYTWMATYINQIKVAMSNFPYKYHILCKGDDMRVVVLVPKGPYTPADMTNIKKDVVNFISETCTSFGHKINIEESYGSCHYFAFSKSASIDQIELPQSLRKIQKAYGANNAFINTLDDYIASTFSNGHSCCKVSPNIIPSFAVSLLWFFYYLLQHDMYKNLSDDSLVSLTMIPSVVGGFPIIYLHNFFVRAESDLLSPFLHLYQFCLTEYPSIATLMGRFISIRQDSHNHKETILMDPYSIPISRPPLPSSVLRSYIPSRLSRLVKNEEFLKLLKLSNSSSQKYINETLLSSRVYRARAISSIYSASPKALIDQYTRKFDSGKSVLDLLLLKSNRRRSNKILERVLKAEIQLQSWRVKRLTNDYLHGDYDLKHLIRDVCPTECADIIRHTAYGKRVEDVTMPPLTHQLQLHYSTTGVFNEWNENNHFNFVTELIPSIITSTHREHYSTGPYQPFIGYTTSSGQLEPTVHFVEKDETLSKVKLLIDICSWMNVSSIDNDGRELTSNIVPLCKAIIAMYTSTDLDTLAPYASHRKSGTAQHHMRSPGFRESIVPNTVSNIYTKIKGESSSHNKLQSSAHHYKVNFLHCYCHSVYLAFSELDFSSICHTPRELWSVTTDCSYCNKPILETPMIVDTTLIPLIQLPELKVTKINRIGESILQKSLNAEPIKPLNVRREQEDLAFNDACLGIITHLVHNTTLHRQDIDNRFHHHVLSEEGYNIMSIISGTSHDKNVGLTEIKSLSIEVIFQFLLQNIHQMILTSRMQTSLKNVRIWINVSPPISLPWYPIINMFLEAGRLPDLVRYAASITSKSCSGGYHDVGTACKYLGMLAIDEIAKFKVNYTLIYLNTYTINRLGNFYQAIVSGHRLYLIKTYVDFKLLTRPTIKSGILEVDAALTMLISGVLICVACYLDDNLIQEWLDLVNERRDNLMPLIDFAELSVDLVIDTYHTWVEDNVEDVVIKKLILHINRWASTKHQSTDINILDEIEVYYDAALDHLMVHKDLLSRDVRIIYTSILDCIQVVRNARRNKQLEQQPEDETASETDSIDDDDGNDIWDVSTLFLIRPVFSIQKSHRMFAFQRFAPLTNHITGVLPMINPVVVITNNSFINYHNFYKSFGLDNASPSIWFTILKSFNMHTVETPLNVLNLHDGHGGVTSLMCKLMEKSDIYFHTVPDDNVYRPEPHSALLVGCGNNHLHYDILSTGYVRISNENVLQRYMRDYPNMDIITNDIEHEDPNSMDYTKLHYNVIRLVVSKGSKSSIYITRIDCRNLDLLTSVVSILRIIFQNVFIVFPIGETFTNGHYIVCWDRIIINDFVVLESLRTFKSKICVDTRTLLSRYVDRFNDRYGTMFRSSFRDDIIYNPLFKRSYFTEICRTFPILGINDLSSRFNLQITMEDKNLKLLWRDLWESINSGKNIHSVLTLHGIKVSSLSNTLRDAITRDSAMYVKFQTWDSNTKAHYKHLILQLFETQGFINTATYLTICDGQVIFSTKAILDCLGNLYNEIRVMWIQQHLDCPLGDSNLSKDRFHEAVTLSYIKGCNLFLRFFAGLLHRCK